MESEDREVLEAIFDAAPDAMLVVDAAGVIRVAAPGVEPLFGYKPAELVGTAIEILVPEALRSAHVRHREHFFEEPANRPMGLGLSLQARRRDGSVFPVDVSLVPSKVGGRGSVGAFVRDATATRGGEDLLRAINELTWRLLAGEPTDATLNLACHQARVLLGGSGAWVVVSAEAGLAMSASAADTDIEEAGRGVAVRAAGSLAAQTVLDGKAHVVEDISSDPRLMSEVREGGRFGPGLWLPLAGPEGPLGALVVARPRGAPQFGEAEVSTAEVFASAAALAWTLGEARHAMAAARIAAEHERIARDLHDTVIQKLFATGMRLQAAERLAGGDVASRIRATVDSIDGVIREIRETIFDLNRPPGDLPHLQQQVRKVAAQAEPSLGFAPRVNFRGPVATAARDEVVEQLLLVLSEALANVSRHARASRVDVLLTAADGSMTLSVSDDGVGMPGEWAAGRGLAEMDGRATRLGGRMSVQSRGSGGTTLQWRVPVGR